jgi:flagellar biosynthesis protein FliR
VTQLANDYFGQSQQQLLVAFLVFLRVGSAMALLPAVGERSVPGRIRLVLAIMFTLVVVPAVSGLIEVGQDSRAQIVFFALTEILIGLAIGFSLRAFVFALQVAGSIAGQSTSLSQIFGATGTEPQPAMGHLLVIAGLALAVTFGLHIRAAELLIYSYQILAPGKFPAAQDFSLWGIAQVAKSFGLAFSIAAPFVIASLIYNIALGAINRAMPQLPVSFVGAPAITAGGLILLLASAPFMLSAWQAALENFMVNPFGTGP